MVLPTKTAIVTGGTRGIGFATARKLAEHGHRVVLTGRSQADGDRAARAIEATVPGSRVVGMGLDLSSLRDVRRFAAAFHEEGWPLHLLVNNAGAMSVGKPRTVTGDGIEAMLATNAIGPFLLTHLLLDALLGAAPARVVNVGSRMHMPGSGMGVEVRWDWENLVGEKSFDAGVFYKNSKLAVMWFTYELDRRLSGKGVTVNAVCPGFVPESLAESFGGLARLFYKHLMPHLPRARTVDEAAGNTVYAATDPRYARQGGLFIADKGEIASSEESHDKAQIDRFWKLACRLTGVDEARLPAPAA
jgi:NAD(P)-dependent dehydrogenase (short-subunit alcohol dehydrogenase family)